MLKARMVTSWYAVSSCSAQGSRAPGSRPSGPRQTLAVRFLVSGSKNLHVIVVLLSSAARSKSMVMGEVSHASGRATSPGLQEGVIKSGWLKKQRSIMKNWQLRWFVLRSDYLYFYKDEEETKPQVPTQGSMSG